MPIMDGSLPFLASLLRSPDADIPDASGASSEKPSGPQPGGQPQGQAGGMIVDHDILRELQDSYLTYAMSTIMDRALPDVRDGLKPSQRRILVSMNDLNLRPGRKHMKCAKICGVTSGDYHPHGEAVIYPTMVGMAQKWKMRQPLVDPQGNFGSIDGDPPAAMRYTEARMTHAAMDMLTDVDMDTVDFAPNYDDRLVEPTVLPAKFPNLLINGGIGIAVGMATSLPPHNPREVLDSIIRVVENPAITVPELMQDVAGTDGQIVRYGIKGPDFPTGGIIHGRQGIIEAYATGRGRIAVRGLVHVEEVGNGRQQIVIDTIPYMLVQNTLVEQIVNAVKEERITEVSDVRNESGREAQSRIVVELKKGADPRVIENQLYEFTSLQDTFSILNIAIVGRRPKTMGLRELIDCYIEHRIEVIRRRTAYLLREAKKKAHILEGMIYAVCDIDEVIKIIRGSKTREEAIQKLMDRRYRIPASHPYATKLPERLMKRVKAAEAEGGILLTRLQAETIGGMRLIQLVGLEIEKLANEYTVLTGEIEGYELILAEKSRVMDIIREDCEEMRARYSQPRLTQIEDSGADVTVAALIPVQDVAVTISHQGYVKRVPIDTYREQGRGGKGIRASDAKDDDFVERVFVASTHDDLLVFTDTGRVFKKKVYEIPEMSRTSRGRAIVNLMEFKEGERSRAYLAVKDFEQGSNYLTFISQRGLVKRTPLKDYINVNRGGIIAVDIREGDSLLDVLLTTGTDDLILVTAQGSAIRFPEDDARVMGRSAGGVKGIELSEEEGVKDAVIGAVAVPMERDTDGDFVTAKAALESNLSLLTITENGYGKRTLVDEYRVQPETGKMRSQSRGGKGRSDIKTSERNGVSVASLGVRDSDGIVVVSRGGQLVRLAANSISTIGRGTQGVRVVRLDEGDKVIGAAQLEGSGADATPPPTDEGSEPTSE